ncbi:glycine cleavage system protein GcvH [Pinisolibacter aquiterrae]|uniref:glycine cleavage system protein GcvH n=1 Tax=Pinisolibacter aquiterrae TaxID=2815579 RepID=UPI001C3DD45F|nr:glycine cleavage system protein GcvH [Pinisolibacter aquiterrae]MBV5266699.1 glycine cleavage system protein GcvH [Pinisolibacter aquiterrae]MCC8234988.1 glycine cleavage system protein GcvH [Pinisolibacter aquiterrae]
MKLYTKDHEWIAIDGDVATVGITTYAQGQLGDVVFVELPDVGKALTKGGEAAVVESVKAASEVYAPLDGTVVEANDKLADDPGLVNLEPEAGGWFLKMKLAEGVDTSDLMDEAAYEAFVQTL